MPKPHLYIHTPVPIFKARVNMPGTITYPISAITYDGVTLGAFGDVAFDATLLLGTAEGLDDLGRVRVKTVPDATSIPIARSSRGTDDGTISIVDNAYITILDDYRVWAKIPWFDLGDEDDDEDDIDFKDGDIPVGTFNVDIPPVANTGPGFADYIDDGNIITVEFPKGGVDLSYAMADGATLTTYAWDVADGTITVGTAASAVITATFPAGFRYVALTVTDSNGVTHTSRCPVLAVDPDDDVTTTAYGSMTQRLTKSGQTLDFELYGDLPRSLYPDGTLVMLWWDSALAPDSRDHMKFIGWLDNENWTIRRSKPGVIRTTTVHCIDGLGRMTKLPGFSQALEREFDEAQWALMPSLDMNKALFYIAFWHSTLINIVDFILPPTGAAYNSSRLDANGTNLMNQLEALANKIVPDHLLLCNSQGQVSFLPNWLLQDLADRPEESPVLTESDFSDLSSSYDRHPKVHVLRSGAILVHTTAPEDEDGVPTVPLVFSVAPGGSEAFGQGTDERIEPEGLALSQDDLNECEGHRYAMLNARHGTYTFRDPRGTLFWSYEPALLYRVQLELSASYAAQRGLDWTEAAGMVEEVTVSYQRQKEGLVIKPSITWTKETVGYPATTYIPPDVDEEYTPPTPPEPFVPPDPTDPDEFFGDITGYIMWTDFDVVRTWDFDEASPTWENISGTISGLIYDCQYMMVDEDTVGAWLMTASAVYFCPNIMATVPVWNEKLTITTVRATAVAPVSGNVIFGCMTHYWSQPGHLCIGMSLDTENDGYLHCYYWVTEDYGDTWTPVDVTAFTFGTSPNERCYYFTGRYSMASFRTAPGTLWCVRGNGRTGTNTGDGAVFISSDLGYTWTKGHIFTGGRMAFIGSILNPYPDVDSPSYVQVSMGGSSPVGTMWVSTDGWATATQITEPAGHEGSFGMGNMIQRVNKNPFDDLHILAQFQIDSSSNADLYDSDDGGATWNLLENLDNNHVTPNGWPPDPDQWVLIDNENDIPFIQLTTDNFATLDSKHGNLSALITRSTGAFAGGFALPKVGANLDVPLPGWGSDSVTAEGSVQTYLGQGVARTFGVESLGDGSRSVYAMIHPPNNIIRIKVAGGFFMRYLQGGFVSGFAMIEFDTGSGITMTGDTTTINCPLNDEVSGVFEVEWERVDPDDDWPWSLEDAEAADDATEHIVPHVKLRVFSSNASTETVIIVTLQIVEMEEEGGTIHTY